MSIPTTIADNCPHRLGEVLERTVCTPAKRRTRSQKLAQEALEIEAEEARAAGALGFMARILVQATLPHSRPKTHEFERVDGRA